MKRILLSLILVLTAAAARADPTGEPLLLAASPALRGYGETVLIAVPFADRHIGFIVNRSTEVHLTALFPEHAPSAKVPDPVYFGGPQSSNAIFAVVRREAGKDAVPLFDGLCLVATAAAVDRVIEQTPEEARFFAGLVVWQPGELAAEIEAGYWYFTGADATLFFRDDTQGLWRELVERLGYRRGLRSTSL